MGLHSRLWVLAVTSLVAAPLSVGVLMVGTPYNFAFLLLYFFFGEIPLNDDMISILLLNKSHTFNATQFLCNKIKAAFFPVCNLFQ